MSALEDGVVAQNGGSSLEPNPSLSIVAESVPEESSAWESLPSQVMNVNSSNIYIT
jgi:hypothetical protein